MVRLRMNAVMFFVSAFLCRLTVSLNVSQQDSKSGKFLSFFSVVQFRHSECLHNSSVGLCVTKAEVRLSRACLEIV